MMKQFKTIGLFAVALAFPEYVAGLFHWRLVSVLFLCVSLLALKFCSLFILDHLFSWDSSWWISIAFYILICIFGALLVFVIRFPQRARISNWYWPSIALMVFGSTIFFFYLRNESFFSQYKLYRIPSESMVPTLIPGDAIIVDRFAYRENEISSGDVIVFNGVPNGSSKVFVKRVISASQGEVLVEDLLAKTDFFSEEVVFTKEFLGVDSVPDRHLIIEIKALRKNYSILIPQKRVKATGFKRMVSNVEKGEVFVLGDNRSASRDSRVFGSFSQKKVIGKVKGVAYSLDKKGFRSERINLDVY